MHPTKSRPLAFFKQFLAHPREVGAILPTSLRTARVMASPIRSTDRVLEMGAGTGTITEAILERIEDPSQLTSVELDPELAKKFRTNYPNVHLVVGDAEEVLRNLSDTDAIISGIPFTVMKKDKRERMFDLIKNRLSPTGVFVAIQYSLSTRKALQSIFRSVEIRWSPLNVPPAFVYICRDPK
ncbi:methyltransferase domain-containing protein [Candidatus Uhrbacteria bacterium]|nr:methyltransferase domain-containing protein [Candidatus Uhrbacteria bacterium]MBD3284071.1 methyltransferase domain-containing protein [Candidatus Uhrbacteria bacterium]